jgi:hypothetical protein
MNGVNDRIVEGRREIRNRKQVFKIVDKTAVLPFLVSVFDVQSHAYACL